MIRRRDGNSRRGQMPAFAAGADKLPGRLPGGQFCHVWVTSPGCMRGPFGACSGVGSLPTLGAGSATRTARRDDWMAAATPVRADFVGWKKLPAKAPDGTPYCHPCRRYYGELYLTEPGPLAQCTAYGKPVYTTRLTYEEAQV